MEVRFCPEQKKSTVHRYVKASDKGERGHWLCTECANIVENGSRYCTECGRKIQNERHIRSGGLCSSCYRKKLSMDRREERLTYGEALAKQKETGCKLGVCDQLKHHHAALADDPERLTSDFIIGLISGPEGQEIYRRKRAIRESFQGEPSMFAC